MKLKIIIGAALSLCCTAFAGEKTITVPEGETITLDDALAAAGLTLEADDVLVKMGGGRLMGTATHKNLAVALRIVEGIFEGNNKDHFFKSGKIAVRDGATLDVNNKSAADSVLLSSRNIYLLGTGCPAAAVTVDNRSINGALLIRGTSSWQMMGGCTFLADGGDATIGTVCNGNMGYLTYGWLSTGNGNHTMTLLGPGHTMNPDGSFPKKYEHRFRFGYGFKDFTGRLVVDGAALTAHNVSDYSVSPAKLPLLVKNGGTYGQEGNAGFANCFSEVTFEWGSFIVGDNSSNADITLPKIAGFPTVGKWMTATVNDDWRVSCAELAQGHVMSAMTPLTFGAKAKVVPTDCATLMVGTEYTLATSTTGVTGCPTLAADDGMSANWKLINGADGKSLKLVYELPELAGRINVTDWGVLPGEENAAANVTAFANGVAAMGADVHTIFFPQGSYYFAEPISIANRSNLTITGDGKLSRIVITGEDAAAALAIAGGNGVTVTGVVFGGVDGLAVDASGVAGLVVTNAWFDGIAGTVPDVSEKHPVRATDCTDVVVSENLVAGGVTYASHLLAEGTTTVAQLEPCATNVVMFAQFNPADKYGTRPFSAALAERGLAAFPQGAKLVKKGLGKMGGIGGTVIGGLHVENGTYVASEAGSFGPSGSVVTTGDEGTVLIEHSNGARTVANSITFVLKGIGAQETGGFAPMCVRSKSWPNTTYCTFRLESDVVIRHVGENIENNGLYDGLFSQSTIDQRGHSLTLLGNGDRDRNQFRFRLSAIFRNSAPIIVENMTLSASYKASESVCFRGENGVKPPLLKILRNSRLLVNNQDFADVFDVYEFEPGAIYEAESAQAIMTSKVKGAPTVHGTVTLTIGEKYVARAADVLADKAMTSVNALTFAEGCELELDDAAAVPMRTAGYVLATSEAAIVRKPAASAELKAAGWTTALSSDGKSLLLKPVSGTMVILR